ncbi:MAG: SH3 domain-containing protein [Geitlerinemataceae cyanobacterium]
MKRHVLVAVLASAIAPVLTVARPASADPLPPLDGFVCTNSGEVLNLRSGPSFDSPTIGQLPNDSRVWLVAPRAGSWQPIATAGARGYVWADYVCEPEMAQIDVDDDMGMDMGNDMVMPSGSSAVPARCGAGDNIRNVSREGGLGVYEMPDFNSPTIASLNDGAAIEIVPTSITNDDGSIWMPLDFPADGYIPVGRDGTVTNIIYCTRFY